MSPAQNDDQQRGAAESSFVRAMRVVRERWLIIVLVTLACVFIALVYSARQEKQYDATAHLLFRNSDLSGVLFGGTLNPTSSDPSRDSFTNIKLVTSNDVAIAAGKKIKSPLTPEQLIAEITVSEEENADVAGVTARDPDPVFAARLANAFADSYVAYRRAADRRKIRESEDAIRARLDELPRTNGNGERRQLLITLQRITSIEALQTGGVEVVDHAVTPTVPAVPQPKRNGVLGFMFGLVLGVSLAFLLDLLDSRLKRTDDFEDAYDLRVITTVPQRAFEAKTESDRVAAFEPYRILRGALDFRMLADDLKTLLVTGPSGQEGTTTVAVNLARAIAIAGQRVVLVEANLRRPGLGRHFALPPGTTGLTSVLAGQVAAGSALRQSGTPGLESLYILPSGPLPGNAPELLESRALHELLSELATFADLVVLDAPPLLPVADARILLDHPAVDATIVISRANKTTRLEARRVRAVLDQHDREPLGLVVCGVKGSLGDVVSHGSNGSGPRSRIRPVTRLGSPREPVGSSRS
jgi:succinoglycan biosynthesis transport protein ExoP